MSAAVAFERVTFSYPGAARRALSDVSFELPPSCFVLVAGATGSGKSTLLRAVNGLVPHFSGGCFGGRVVVAGRDTISHAPRHLADVAAFVPQDPTASFVLDRVEDELAYAMENLAVEPDVMRDRVDEILDVFDIGRLRRRSVRSLSGGERQRVAIAASLTPGARVLLLDEPTSQLDPHGAQEVLDALHRLVRELGFTVLVAEHRLDRIAGYADVALGCVAGEVVAGETPEILERLELGPPVATLGRALGWKPLPLTLAAAQPAAAAVELPDLAPVRARTSVAPLLAARSVTAAYGDQVALHEVSLELARGDVAALVGANGAGKSTLLRVLAGLHIPRDGRVVFAGRGVRTGRDVALCPQAPEDVLFADSVLAEIAATTAHARHALDPRDVAAELGIGGLVDRHPRDLSAGQRLLVAIAAVAATGAPILLLDEPTRGLDPETKEALGRSMQRWARTGRAVLFATHDVELAADLAPRVVMLSGGEVVTEGPAAEVLAQDDRFAPQMTRLFGPGWLTPRQVAAALGAT